MKAGRSISDLIDLLLYGKPFDADTPADRDFVVYESDTASWHLERNLLSPISGIAFLTEGYDLDVDGDILMATGAEVDGVDISEECLLLSGGPLGSPLTNSIMYYGTGPTGWKTGHSALLDGANTALHFHDADRARAVHTGTQAASTISDFEDTVGDMFVSSDNAHDMVTVEYGSDEKVNLSLDVPLFYGLMPSNTATNGANWVDIPLNVVGKVQFTHTDGNANVEFDVAGQYMIAATVVADFNVNNQLMHMKIVKDVGVGYSDLAGSSRMSHTSTALGSLISFTIGPYGFSTGDEIKLQSGFNSADAGSNFIADKCSLSIWRIS